MAGISVFKPQLIHASDLKIGTRVATLPGAWRYGISVRTGWPGVSILSLGEKTKLHVKLSKLIRPYDTLCMSLRH